MTVYELRKKLENIVNQNKEVAVWKDDDALISDKDRIIEVQDGDMVYIVSR